MINTENGDFKIKNFTLGKTTTKQEFLNSQLYKDVTYTDDLGNGYFHYFLRKQDLNEKNQYRIEIHFDPSGKLCLIDLSASFDDDTDDWSDWTLEREMRRKKVDDEYLQKNYGNPPYNYAWGSIDSTYDPRSGGSSICIRYKY